MLSDLKKISDREEISPETLRKAASTLLSRQFLYSDSSRDRVRYQCLVNNRTYYESLFDAIDHHFIYDQEYGMVGVVPRSRDVSESLKKDETIILLILRLLFEEAVDAMKVVKGRARASSTELLAKFEMAVGPDSRPSLSDLRSMLNSFKRSGLIDDLRDDDRVFDFQIRPSVRSVLNEGWLKVLELHTGLIQEDVFDDEEDNFSDSEDDGGVE